MYVIGFEAEYGVTAKTKVSFTCEDAERLNKTLKKIEVSNTPAEIIMVSTGINTEGKMVSRFKIKWSFKKKA